LRWVAGGAEGDAIWDVFLAPVGRLLSEIVAAEGRLFWPDTRSILEQLADELTIAGAEGTLPAFADVDQVWVRPDGQVLLLDFPCAGRGADALREKQVEHGGGTIELLRRTAALALEGKPRPPDQAPAPIRAPVPLHAAKILKRLFNVPQNDPAKKRWYWRSITPSSRQVAAIGWLPYNEPEQMRADIATVRDMPVEVTRACRAAYLLRPDSLISVGCVLGFGAMGAMAPVAQSLLGLALIMVNLWPACCTFEEWLTRGPYLAATFGGGPVTLLRSDGGRPLRRQAALRCLLSWAPLCSLLSLAIVIRYFTGEVTVSRLLWFVAVATVLILALLTLLRPNCGLHDRLVGTYLVPE
jgi:hypothetical protein